MLVTDSHYFVLSRLIRSSPTNGYGLNQGNHIIF